MNIIGPLVVRVSFTVGWADVESSCIEVFRVVAERIVLSGHHDGEKSKRWEHCKIDDIGQEEGSKDRILLRVESVVEGKILDGLIPHELVKEKISSDEAHDKDPNVVWLHVLEN